MNGHQPEEEKKGESERPPIPKMGQSTKGTEAAQQANAELNIMEVMEPEPDDLDNFLQGQGDVEGGDS